VLTRLRAGTLLILVGSEVPLQPLDKPVRIGQIQKEPAAQAELGGLLRSGAAGSGIAENAQLSRATAWIDQIQIQ
jgi:hypothetical protein